MVLIKVRVSRFGSEFKTSLSTGLRFLNTGFVYRKFYHVAQLSFIGIVAGQGLSSRALPSQAN